jgi:hypothetical protein
MESQQVKEKLTKYIKFRYTGYIVESSQEIISSGTFGYEFRNLGLQTVSINGIILLGLPLGALGSPLNVYLEPNLTQERSYGNLNVDFGKNTFTCGAIVGSSLIACAGLPQCEYLIEITLDGVLIANKFNIECTMTIAEIQALFVANLFPQFAGIIVVFSFNPTLTITVSGIFPNGAGVIGFTITGMGVNCQINSSTASPLTCRLTKSQKLLVIEKYPILEENA